MSEWKPPTDAVEWTPPSDAVEEKGASSEVGAASVDGSNAPQPPSIPSGAEIVKHAYQIADRNAAEGRDTLGRKYVGIGHQDITEEPTFYATPKTKGPRLAEVPRAGEKNTIVKDTQAYVERQNEYNKLKQVSDVFEQKGGKRAQNVDLKTLQANFDNAYLASTIDKTKSEELKKAESELNAGLTELDKDYIDIMASETPQRYIETIDKYTKISDKKAKGEELTDAEKEFMYDIRQNALMSKSASDRVKIMDIEDGVDLVGFNKQMSALSSSAKEIDLFTENYKARAANLQKLMQGESSAITTAYESTAAKMNEEYQRKSDEFKAEIEKLNADYKSGKIDYGTYKPLFEQTVKDFDDYETKYKEAFPNVDEVNKKLGEIQSKYNTLGEGISSEYQGKIDEYNKKVQEIQKRTGVTPEILNSLGSAYENLGVLQGAAKVNDAQNKNIATERGLDVIRDEQRKDSNQVTELTKGVLGTMGTMMLGLGKLPKSLGVDDPMKYDFFDKLYDSSDSIIKGSKGTWGAVEGQPAYLKYAYGLGQGIGSMAMFVAGGSAAKIAKIPEAVGVFGSSFILSQPENYTEALEAGMDSDEARRYSMAVSSVESIIESLIPDSKFATETFKKTVMQAFRSGKTVKEGFNLALKQLPESTASFFTESTKEGAEEFFQTLGGDITKEAINSLSGAEYYKNTFDPDAYKESFLTGAMTRGFTKFFARTDAKSPETIEAMRDAVDMRDQIVANIKETNPELASEVKSVLDKAAEGKAALEAHSNWQNLTPEAQNKALDLVWQMERAEDARKMVNKFGIEDKGNQKEVERIAAELNNIFENKENFKPNDKKNETGVRGAVGVGEAPVETQPDEAASGKEAETNRIFQEQEVEDTRPAEDVAAAEADYDAVLSSVKEAAPDFSEDDADHAASLVQEFGVTPQDAIDFVKKEGLSDAKTEPVSEAQDPILEAVKARNPTSVVGKIWLEGLSDPATREETISDIKEQAVNNEENVRKEIGDEAADLILGENVSKKEQEIDTTAEQVEQTDTTPTQEAKDNAKKFVDLYYGIKQAATKSEQREAARQRREFLEANPRLKFIDDNISKINKVLEGKGLLTKSEGCP